MQDPMDVDPESVIAPWFKLQCSNESCRFGGIYSQWYRMTCPLCKFDLIHPQEKKRVAVVKSKACSLK